MNAQAFFPIFLIFLEKSVPMPLLASIFSPRFNIKFFFFADGGIPLNNELTIDRQKSWNVKYLL